MKCLSVVPGSFPGEGVRERNHYLFSGAPLVMVVSS